MTNKNKVKKQEPTKTKVGLGGRKELIRKFRAQQLLKGVNITSDEKAILHFVDEGLELAKIRAPVNH